jgi:AGZA family xanthine/uracil permease-like MFS transporter
MRAFFEHRFQLERHGTTVRREAMAGVTTFLTLSYIFFVQPTILKAAGMDAGAVLVATCLASAVGTLAMGLWANYPIALAPGMGHNVFFAFTVCAGMGIPWQTALGAICMAGLVFILVSGVGLREKMIDAIPRSLKSGIAVGIGLLIAFVGFQWAGVVVGNPGTLVGLGPLAHGPVVLALGGFILIAVLTVARVPGAILIGILATAAAGWPLGYVNYQGIASTPPSLAPTFLQLDLVDPLRRGLLNVVFIFFILALFDTIGTLIGVGEQAGLLENGRLPRARQALLSDAVATVTGAALGTSTVTSYIESASGVAAGGRTGLANLFTAGLMLGTLFCYPLVQMIGEGYRLESGTTLYPALAPALIIVGIMMMRHVAHIDWQDMTEGVPAFFTIVMMPFSFSITDGIAFGFIAYAILKLAAGRGRDVPLLLYVFAGLFVVRYVWLG